MAEHEEHPEPGKVPASPRGPHVQGHRGQHDLLLSRCRCLWFAGDTGRGGQGVGTGIPGRLLCEFDLDPRSSHSPVQTMPWDAWARTQWGSTTIELHSPTLNAHAGFVDPSHTPRLLCGLTGGCLSCPSSTPFEAFLPIWLNCHRTRKRRARAPFYK